MLRLLLLEDDIILGDTLFELKVQ